jgi:hypothetical protein
MAVDLARDMGRDKRNQEKTERRIRLRIFIYFFMFCGVQSVIRDGIIFGEALASKGAAIIERQYLVQRKAQSNAQSPTPGHVTQFICVWG